MPKCDVTVSFLPPAERGNKRARVERLTAKLSNHVAPEEEEDELAVKAMIPLLAEIADKCQRAGSVYSERSQRQLKGLRRDPAMASAHLTMMVSSRRNRWRKDDSVLFVKSWDKKKGEKEKGCEVIILRNKLGNSDEVEYEVSCDLCRTSIAVTARVVPRSRWRRFRGVRNYKDARGKEVIPTQLGYLYTKAARAQDPNSNKIHAHQLCLDYAMGENMVQKFSLPFEEHLDGFPISAIEELLKKRSKRCAFCDKKGACTNCAEKNCRSKKRSWYHLPCGQKKGSKQIPGEKKSLCPMHAHNDDSKPIKMTLKRPCGSTSLSPPPQQPPKKRSRKCPTSSSLKQETPSGSQETSLYEQLAEFYDVRSEEDEEDEEESVDVKVNPLTATVAASSIKTIDLTGKTFLKAIDLDEVMKELEDNATEEQEEEEDSSSLEEEDGDLLGDSAAAVAGPIDLKTEMVPIMRPSLLTGQDREVMAEVAALKTKCARQEEELAELRETVLSQQSEIEEAKEQQSRKEEKDRRHLERVEQLVETLRKESEMWKGKCLRRDEKTRLFYEDYFREEEEHDEEDV